MFEIFGYIFCFIAGFGITNGLMLLVRNDGESSLPPDKDFDRMVLKKWKPIGLMGGLLSTAYYGLAPRDEGLHAILTAIWQAAGGSPV